MIAGDDILMSSRENFSTYAHLAPDEMMTRYDLMAGERNCSKSISLHRILDWMDKNISLDIFAVRRLRKGVGTIDMDDRYLNCAWFASLKQRCVLSARFMEPPD